MIKLRLPVAVLLTAVMVRHGFAGETPAPPAQTAPQMSQAASSWPPTVGRFSGWKPAPLLARPPG